MDLKPKTGAAHPAAWKSAGQEVPRPSIGSASLYFCNSIRATHTVATGATVDSSHQWNDRSHLRHVFAAISSSCAPFAGIPAKGVWAAPGAQVGELYLIATPSNCYILSWYDLLSYVSAVIDFMQAREYSEWV